MDTSNPSSVPLKMGVSPTPERKSFHGNRGEWIDFKELCRRVPSRSGCTLRRYAKDGVISYRQLGGKRSPLEFNWKTVERELAVLTKEGVNAQLAAVVRLPPEGPPDLVRQFEELRALVQAIADRLGVAAPHERKAAG